MASLPRLMTRLVGIGLVCLILAGCLEEERTITLEPDGRGSFRLTRTLGAELSKELLEVGIQDETALAEGFAAGSLADFEGVVAWSDVVAAITTDRRIRFEATGWFEDVAAVHERNDTSGKQRPLLSVSREGDRLKLGLDMGSGKDAQPGAKNDAPIAQVVEGVKKLIGGLRIETTLVVPGEASGLGGWRASGRTLSHRLDEARLLPLLDGLPEGAAGQAELNRRFEEAARAEATVTVRPDAASPDFAERLRAAVEGWKTSTWRPLVEEKRAEQKENAELGRSLLEDPPARPAAPPDAFEPNDAREQARPLAPGKHEGLVAEHEGEDWFALTVPAGHELRVSLQAPANEALHASLTGEKGEIVASGMLMMGKPEQLRLVAGETERKAWLQVQLGEHSPYTVAVEVIPWKAADAFEPNDLETAAARLAPGKHDDLLSDGSDWYRIDPTDAAPGRMLEVELRWVGGPGRGGVTLAALGPRAWDTLGTTVASKHKTAAQLRVIVPEGGARLHVTGDLDVRYALSITVKDKITDALEPNDAPDQARALGPGKHEAVLEGPDWYRVDCPEGKQLRLRLARVAEKDGPKADLLQTLAVEVYAPDDPTHEEDRESASFLGKGGELVVARRAKGPRLVRVKGDGVVRYTLEVVEEAWKPEDRFEPNDVAGDAAPLGPGRHEARCAKHDWYLVELPADQRLRFTLTSKRELMLQMLVLDAKDGDMLADALTGGEGDASAERTIDVSSAPRKLRVHIQRVFALGGADDTYTLEVKLEKR